MRRRFTLLVLMLLVVVASWVYDDPMISATFLVVLSILIGVFFLLERIGELESGLRTELKKDG